MLIVVMNVFSTCNDNYLSLGLKCDKSDNVTFIEFNYQLEKWLYSSFVSLFCMWRNGCHYLMFCMLVVCSDANSTNWFGDKINEYI